MWQRVLPQPAPARDHRRRSPRAPRRRWPRPSTCPLQPKSDLALLYGLAHLLIARGLRSTATSSTRTPTGFDEFAAHVAAFTPERVARRDRAAGRRRSSGSADTIARGQAGVVLVDDGREPEPRGRPHRAGDHQPRPDDRQHRPARAPARTRSPASATPWARGCSATPRTCSAAATSPTPGHRAEVAGILGIDASRIPDRPEPGLRPDHRGHPSTGRSRACGSSPPTRPTRGSTRATSHERARPARLPRRAGHVHHDRDGPAGRPRPARRRLGREGRHVHQLRAPLRPASRRVARAPGQALADFSIFKLVADAWGCGEMFARVDVARGGVRDPQAPLAPAGPATSPASTATTMLDERGGVQWPYAGRRARDRAPERRLFEDGRFFHPDGRARFVFEEPRPVGRAHQHASSRFVLLTGRGSSSPVAHADPHGEVGGPAHAVPRPALRRDRPGRRRRPRRGRRRLGGRRLAPGRDAGPGLRHADGRRRARSSCRCTTPAPTG